MAAAQGLLRRHKNICKVEFTESRRSCISPPNLNSQQYCNRPERPLVRSTCVTISKYTCTVHETCPWVRQCPLVRVYM